MKLNHLIPASLLLVMMPFVSCGDDNEGDSPSNDNNDINKDKAQPDNNEMFDNHEYVDLDLPSGILWSTMNVGATKPEECGDYFAWGETAPKEEYNIYTYKWIVHIFNDRLPNKSIDSLFVLTKYTGQLEDLYNHNIENQSYFSTVYGGETDRYTDYIMADKFDNLFTLLPENDAATVNWGKMWRTPTDDEWKELIDNCRCTRTELNGIGGFRIRGKNGNSIFLPDAYYKNDKEINYNASCEGGNIGPGWYWSSSLYFSDLREAFFLGFGKNGHIEDGYVNERWKGLSIRPVRK